MHKYDDKNQTYILNVNKWIIGWHLLVYIHWIERQKGPFYGIDGISNCVKEIFLINATTSLLFNYLYYHGTISVLCEEKSM